MTRDEIIANKARLPGADLAWADLSGANLSGANMPGANLSRANLSGANLSRANLSRANLSRVNLSMADLSEANLPWANLSEANLSEANLSRADLSRANLSRVNLSMADLSGAYLSRADLSGANLSGANLSGTTLSEANLSGANLSGTKGLQSATEFMRQFKTDALGVIVYRNIGDTTFNPNPEWKLSRGRFLTEVPNPLPTVLCGCGVNFATRNWCLANAGDTLWRCRIRWEDLPDVVVPYNTDGKARCARLELIAKDKSNKGYV
jgi:uncharacterized protein YjbI with pentapeptide repeats